MKFKYVQGPIAIAIARKEEVYNSSTIIFACATPE